MKAPQLYEITIPGHKPVIIAVPDSIPAKDVFDALEHLLPSKKGGEYERIHNPKRLT